METIKKTRGVIRRLHSKTKESSLIAFVRPFPSTLITLINEVGWGNGYVAVPTYHKCWGIDYDIADQHVRIHGGLTYSKSCDVERGDPLLCKGMWVLGFDTCHLHDKDKNREWVIAESERLKKQLKHLKNKNPRVRMSGGSDKVFF